MLSKLVVGGVELGFDSELPISTNLSVADIREPDKRDAGYSKSINVPMTGAANKLFEFIFDVNIDLQTFNPNKAVDAYYESKHLRIFTGKLQLHRVVKKYDGENWDGYYVCQIIGTTGNLFLDISTKFLTDIDFQDLDHTLNYTNFSATPTPGVGYCYGYIDYGLAGLNGYNWNVEHMKAAIFEKEYVDRIFADAGYTYTSSFFNSAYYANIAIPDVNAGPYQFSPLQVANNQFYAGLTVASSNAGDAGIFNPLTNNYTYTQTSGFFIVFDDDSTAPFNDAGGLYNTVTGKFVPTNITSNIVTTIINYSLVLTAPAGAATFQGSSQIYGGIHRNGGGPVASQISTLSNINVAVSAGTVTITSSFAITYSSTNDPVGTIYAASLTLGQLTGKFKDAGGSDITSGAASVMTVRQDVGSVFYNTLASLDVKFGSTVEMNTTIPQNVKQLDFLKSIFMAHNLYIEQDKTDPNNYIIEPREAFISYTNALDWTKKQDLSREITHIPMGELEGKRYLWSYRSDRDYFNARYENKFKEIYGQKEYNVDNDFINKEKRFELIFSPSPGVAFQTDIVAPRFLTIDGAYPGNGAAGTVRSLKVNIRRLYWGGMKNCYLHNLRSSTAGNIQISQYPSLNHFDDPNTPTVDLCFDAPRDFYFTKPAQLWTNNNLYGYYSKFVEEVTDPNSMIVKTYMVFEERDIAEFSFRKIVFIEKQYYFVNAILDYDPQVRKSIPVELLKLKRGQTFLPVNYDPNDPPPNQNQSRFVPPEYNEQGNYGMTGNMVVGRQLIHGGENGILTGSLTQVQFGVQGFDGIGLSGQSIDQSYSNRTLIRSAFMVSDEGVEFADQAREVNTADFTMNMRCNLYYVDATAGNITVTLPSLDTNAIFTLVRVDDSANTVDVVGALGTEEIRAMGVALTTDPVPGYTTRRYSSNYTAWYY